MTMRSIEESAAASAVEEKTLMEDGSECAAMVALAVSEDRVISAASS